MAIRTAAELLAQLVGYEDTQSDALYGILAARRASYTHLGDAAAGTAYVKPIAYCTKATRIKSGHVIPEDVLTADNSNYATIGLGYNDGAGGAATVLCSRSTTITDTNDWVAGTALSLNANDADVIPAGSYLCLVVTKTGTGVDCPAYQVAAELELV